MRSDFGSGLYLDESARPGTMLRAKAVLGTAGLIDHHSDRGGFTPSPAANYLELFPFLDSLWYGEGFDYEGSNASYWLVEISGLPHGLSADLLRYKGMTPAHFKGMTFANANRWQSGAGGPAAVDNDPFSPLAIWRLWESFGIQEAVMHGWWLERERGAGSVPVVSGREGVKVTAFVRHGRATLLAVASFEAVDANVTLAIDWDALGLAAGLELVAPELPPMQKAARFDCKASLPVAAGQGWLLLLGPAYSKVASW